MRKNAENLPRGFSLLEALVVMGIVSVVLTMAILSFTSVLPNARANSALDQVLSQMRSAREQAIAHRREVQVQFVGTNQLTISELWLKGTPPPPVTFTFEGGAQYMVFPGVPDTPMGFGNSSSIYFANLSGGPPIMKFTTNGALIDGNNNPVNGTVFLGISGKNQTARAITILGATGRVRQYHWDGNQWQE
jgi:prepilin-type N-terminal cleavage/methylation domain-containing protein